MKSPFRHLFILICLSIFAGALSSARSALGQESAPTDSDIFYSGAFQHPLIPVGGATTPLENSALSKAITLYAAAKDQDDHSAILNFLSEFPHSPWRTALLNNLGLRYRETGWFLKALAVWEEAWDLSKNDTSRFGKPLADCIIGELARLNANLGRRAELENVLKEIGDRPLIGAAMERVTVAREGMWMMRHEPENTFRCGPLALARLAACNDPQAARDPKILSARSTGHGTSLSQVWRLSRDAGMNFQMAKRGPGSTVIVPSLVSWKANHFAALVREDQGKFLVQDPTSNEVLAVSQAALDAESTGYFLVPDGPLPKGWSRVSEEEGRGVWGAGGTIFHDNTGTKPWDDKAICLANPPPPGMATYNFHTQLVSLNIMDTPVGYTPPLGPDMHFTLTYNQRERTEANGNYFSGFGPIPGSGQLWKSNWIAHVQRSGAGWPAFVHLPGGGVEEVGIPNPTPAPHKQSGAILTLEYDQVTQLEYYKRVLPDGSTQLFELLSNGFRWLMTKWIDPQGDTVLFNYCPEGNCANYDPARPRLLSVTDALGQVTTIEYVSNDQQNIPDYFLIERIEDPFGRFAWFEYNSNRQLWKIHDVIGIVSEFEYEPGTDFIDTLITPYKTTEFSRPASTLDDGGVAGNARIIQAVDPETGATERVEFGHQAPGIAETETTLPDVGRPIFNGLYRARNSFYWDKKSTAMHPPEKGVYDYTKAKLIHWLHRDNDTASNIKEREKMPLEDAVYYLYPGQGAHANATAFEGTSGFPSVVARVLADNTTQLWRYEYDNPFLKLTKATDPTGRETSYQYAANGIDLIAVFQGNDQIFGSTYTDTQSHLPHVVTDAAGQTTTYTYTASKQLETVTNAKGEITEYKYGNGSPGKPVGYLTKITGPSVNGSSATTSFTYDEDHRVQTVTMGPDGYTVTMEYDALDRPTRKTYFDGTYEEFQYTQDFGQGPTTILDLTASRDRLGRWTYRHYTADRQMDSITDPAGRTTEYDWCSCGSLTSITDPKDQMTTFHRDLQGRVHQKVFADDTTINYLYEGQSGPNTEGATSRLESSTDALNRRTNYSYFSDNNISSVSYTNTSGGQLNPPTPTVDYTYEPNHNRVATMNDGTGQTIYDYYPMSVLGAGQLKSIDGPLVDDAIAFVYDQLGRTVEESVNKVAQTIEYDALGRLSNTKTDALGSIDRSYDGVTPRLQAVNYPSGQTTNYTYFGNNDDRRLQTLENLDSGAGKLSQFDYTYDDEGQIMSWLSLLGATNSGRWFEYDNARQLLNSRNGATPNAATEIYNYEYDAAGNRIGDAHFNPWGAIPNGIFHVYSPNILNQIESFTTDDGMFSTVPVELFYDLAGNLTDDGEGKTFEWDAANRLTGINYGSGQRTEFAYDGLSRRVMIVEKMGSTVTSTKQFVWMGTRIAEERDANNDITRRYYAEGEERIGGQDRGPYHYTRDHLGSIRELTDSSGNVQTRYDYDPYGKQTKLSGTLEVDFGYTGHYFHAPSGLNLTLFRAYNPSLGRWLSRDPIGEEGGLNLYGYVLNNPINHVDPLGLIDAWPGPAPGEIRTLPTIPFGRKVDPLPIPFMPNPIFPVGGCSLAFEACERNCATEYGTCPANEYDKHSRCEKRCKTLYEYCKDTQR